MCTYHLTKPLFIRHFHYTFFTVEFIALIDPDVLPTLFFKPQAHHLGTKLFLHELNYIKHHMTFRKRFVN